MTMGGLYFAKLWRDDYRATVAGSPPPNALPGATPASSKAIVIAVIGALILLAGETGGEIALGLSDEQSTITVLFGVYTLVAAVIEEIIFRGFIVVTHRGPLIKWLAVLGASLVFTALHPFLWNWEDNFEWTINAKGWFSTTFVFLNSLWFYTARLARFNPTQSLLPCFAAHFAKNAGVLAIKAAQGFLVG